MDFLTAKSRKVAHWRDTIAFTEMLPIWFAGIPGHENSFSDFLSHVHDELVGRAARQKAAKSKIKVEQVLMCVAGTEAVYNAPGMMGEDAVDEDALELPTGYKAAVMNFSDDEWAELCRGYLKDDTELREVKISTIYDVMVNGGKEVSKVEKKKIMGWKHRIFPMEVGDESVALFVKAPTVMQDEVDWAESVEETDEASMKVVLLMPSKVLMRVTGVPLEEEEKDESSYRFRDLRMDMLVMSHEFQLHGVHAKVGLMYLFVTQF